MAIANYRPVIELLVHDNAFTQEFITRLLCDYCHRCTEELDKIATERMIEEMKREQAKNEH